MTFPLSMKLPRYVDYYNNTFKIVEAPGGRLRGYVLDVDSGRFTVANSILSKVLLAHGEDITYIGEEEFIELTEEKRARYLRGEGPIFSIYKQIDEWFAQKDSLDRDEWRRRRDLISELRRRTFAMWEDEFARQEAGEPPSFRYEPEAGLAVAEKMRHVDTTPDMEWRR